MVVQPNVQSMRCMACCAADCGVSLRRIACNRDLLLVHAVQGDVASHSQAQRSCM
jgi:hypothetical protein